MSRFEQQVNIFARKVDDRARKVLAGSVEAIKVSIRDGDPFTGSPGQPVQMGDLRDSWDSTVDGDEGHVFSSHPAAKVIESGTRAGRALVLRSSQGGFHSVALTIAAADRLVEGVAREVVGA